MLLRGYVGYDDGKTLVEKVRKKPYSVVLFDEIEKANEEVLNILLQILEDGKLTDSNGREASFQENLIILTSNIGAEILDGKKNIGFISSKEEMKKDLILGELKKLFKPELINRIDEILIFSHLTEQDMHLIFRKKLHEIEEVLGEKNIKIVVSQDLENYIINNSNYFKYGARIIRRQIEQNIEDVVVNEMIQKKIKNNFTFNLDYNEKQGVFIKEKNKV